MADRKASLIITLKDEVSAGLRKIMDNVRGFTDVYFAAKAAVQSFNETFGRLIAFTRDALREYGEQERAVRRLTVALQNQGFYTKEYAAGLTDVAAKLQEVTTETDEAIMESMRLFTSFGIAGKEMNIATKAALDLSAGLGIDLHSATMMIAKAYEGNTTALGRYVGKINEALPATERLGEVARLVNSKFGGQAAAELETYAGKVKKLEKAYGELKETLGGFVVGPAAKALDFLANSAKGYSMAFGGSMAVAKGGGGDRMTFGPGGELVPMGGNAPASKKPVDVEAEAAAAKEAKRIQDEQELAGFEVAEKARIKLESLTMTHQEVEAAEAAHLARMLEAEGQHEAAKAIMEAQAVKASTEQAKIRSQVLLSSLQQIASLANAKNKELAAVGKAAAIASAVISAHTGAARAFRDLPFPANFVVAGLVEAAGLAQAAQIAGVQLASGGMVLPRSGGTLATVGEAGRAEAVVPLDDPTTKAKLRDTLGGGGGITINAGVVVADRLSVQQFAQMIDEELFKLNRNRRSVAF